MSCSICVKYKKNNAFTKGTNNFRSSTLERHVAHHRQTTLWPMGGEFQRAVREVLDEKEEAVLVELKPVNWAAEE
ncbi:unnamed protein product [Pocillopora meandrina]|uniref:C17orf113 probable zinc finger domain-containing protein n=1 Tax=Pocillopora meandrina TaxID=46732 RepID=A0AAU9X0P6_9CNID|nr:unnamed protein product [Pocillopora meandrina]